MKGDKGGGRIVPNDLASEQAVLGACMMESAAISTAREYLTLDSFYRNAHRAIFKAICDMQDQGAKVDITTLSAHLSETDRLEIAGGRAYIAALLDQVPTAAHVEYYAQIVERLAVRRAMIFFANDMSDKMFGEVEDLDEAVAQAQEAFYKAIARKSQNGSVVLAGDAARRSLERIKDRMDNPTRVRAIPTGIGELDRLIGGIWPGTYTVIAGPSSGGKSALGHQLLLAGAFAGYKGAIFSIENGEDGLCNRFISMRAEVTSRRLRTGQLNYNQVQRVEVAAARIGQAPLKIITPESVGNGGAREQRITASYICSTVRKLKQQGEVDFIVVDYLQLVKPEKKAGSRTEEVAEISHALQALARTTGVAVVALSQANQDHKMRADKRPVMGDVRESQDIVHDCDLLLMPYRKSYFERGEDGEDLVKYDWEDPRMEDAYIFVVKARDGAQGYATCYWQGAYTRFVDKAREDGSRGGYGQWKQTEIPAEEDEEYAVQGRLDP